MNFSAEALPLAVHKTTSTDDKRLQSTLKRLGVNTIPGIEEVLLINADGSALQFNNPKVQASIAANTYVVSGASQHKRKPRRRCRHGRPPPACCCPDPAAARCIYTPGRFGWALGAHCRRCCVLPSCR